MAIAQAPCHDLQAIATVQQDLLTAFPATGSSCVQVDQRGVLQYRAAAGSYTLQTVVPIASATKTLSAAVLMSLVDSGLLSLNDTVGQWLPEWNTGARAAITLRMCFTHTAGLPAASPAVGDDTITLRTAAMQIANVPLQYAPGSGFLYGGVSMHVAGAVCEVAAGQSWNQLFQQRIATPLGMTATDFGAFGSTANPRIAGGARSNLADFAAFVDMLRNRGTRNGVQVLTPASVDEMLLAQTVGVPVIETPHPDNAPYGIGTWIERRDAQGHTLLAEAAGAFGFIGWVDRAHDASGVFLVRNSNDQTFPYMKRIWAACDDALFPDGVTCVGAPSPACTTGAWLGGSIAARTGAPEFAFVMSRAPTNGFGALLLGDVVPGGAVVGDLALFVGPVPAFLGTMVADADGRARLSVPLIGVPAGLVVGLQAAWLAGPCTALGIQTSHGVALNVLP